MMVAAHGWLLEYPVIYCYVCDAAASIGRSSCLGGEVLHVIRVTARRATGVQQEPRDTEAHVVISFSVPALTHASAQPASVTRWMSAMRGRFAQQTSWRHNRIDVVPCTQQSVVL
uniref:Uncharacterized protein n=1 Tax=Prymnesium polylepis TaxID=72548 RepID=A0A7S4J494_9EUKA